MGSLRRRLGTGWRLGTVGRLRTTRPSVRLHKVKSTEELIEACYVHVHATVYTMYNV